MKSDNGKRITLEIKEKEYLGGGKPKPAIGSVSYSSGIKSEYDRSLN